MTPNKQPARILFGPLWATAPAIHETCHLSLKGMASSLQHYHVNGIGHGRRTSCARNCHHHPPSWSSAAPLSDPRIRNFPAFNWVNRTTLGASRDYSPRMRSTKWMVESFWMLYSSRVRSFSSSLPAKTARCWSKGMPSDMRDIAFSTVSVLFTCKVTVLPVKVCTKIGISMALQSTMLSQQFPSIWHSANVLWPWIPWPAKIKRCCSAGIPWSWI